MKFAFFLVLTLPLIAGVGISDEPGTDHYQLALRWAPRIYHDTNDAYGYEAEYLTNVDFDENFDGTDNWENLHFHPLHAWIYYRVMETHTHWFINYNAFHPRDDGPIFDQHENDFEGALMVIRKDGSQFGVFQLVLTLAHDEIFQFTNDGGISTASDDVDGGVLFDVNGHPELYIQANGFSATGNGHGWDHYDGGSAPGGDGIVYVPGEVAEVPFDGAGNWVHEYTYALRPMEELWSRRNNSLQLYAGWGRMRGDTHGVNAVSLPWRWDDPNDGPVLAGAMWSDPAHMVDTHLQGLGSFSRQYAFNDNYTHRIKIDRVTSLVNRDSLGGRSDIYVNVWIDGIKYWDERLWKKDDAAPGTAYTVGIGRNEAGVTTFDGWTNELYVARPPGSQIRIEVFDSDGTSGDDFMGSLEFSLNPGEFRSGNDLTSNGEARISYHIECIR